MGTKKSAALRETARILDKGASEQPIRAMEEQCAGESIGWTFLGQQKKDKKISFRQKYEDLRKNRGSFLTGDVT
ncbi:MAG: hypothetical protein ABUL66_04640 [Verrucomicrobiota bacterium]|jgi:hypothetical protein